MSADSAGTPFDPFRPLVTLREITHALHPLAHARTEARRREGLQEAGRIVGLLVSLREQRHEWMKEARQTGYTTVQITELYDTLDGIGSDCYQATGSILLPWNTGHQEEVKAKGGQWQWGFGDDEPQERVAAWNAAIHRGLAGRFLAVQTQFVEWAQKIATDRALRGEPEGEPTVAVSAVAAPPVWVANGLSKMELRLFTFLWTRIGEFIPEEEVWVSVWPAGRPFKVGTLNTTIRGVNRKLTALASANRQDLSISHPAGHVRLSSSDLS